MRWRVMVELTWKDGTIRTHEVSAGASTTTDPSSATIGLTLAGGKRTLAGLQDHLVRAQTEELPWPPALPSLWVSTATQGCAHPAAVFAVRNGGGSRAALFALSVCGDEPSHAAAKRFSVSRTVDGASPVRRAISCLETLAEHRRKISRI
jgi:hypothetical protein